MSEKVLTSEQNTLTPEGEPLFQDDFTPEQNFQYALRLLRIAQAWSMTPGHVPHPAQHDLLYPGNRKDQYGNYGNPTAFRNAVGNFLKRFEVSGD